MTLQTGKLVSKHAGIFVALVMATLFPPSTGHALMQSLDERRIVQRAASVHMDANAASRKTGQLDVGSKVRVVGRDESSGWLMVQRNGRLLGFVPPSAFIKPPRESREQPTESVAVVRLPHPEHEEKVMRPTPLPHAAAPVIEGKQTDAVQPAPVTDAITTASFLPLVTPGQKAVPQAAEAGESPQSERPAGEFPSQVSVMQEDEPSARHADTTTSPSLEEHEQGKSTRELGAPVSDKAVTENEGDTSAATLATESDLSAEANLSKSENAEETAPSTEHALDWAMIMMGLGLILLSMTPRRWRGSRTGESKSNAEGSRFFRLLMNNRAKQSLMLFIIPWIFTFIVDFMDVNVSQEVFQVMLVFHVLFWLGGAMLACLSLFKKEGHPIKASLGLLLNVLILIGLTGALGSYL